MTKEFQPTNADIEIEECLNTERSFAVVAGAGSGKTTSLIRALNFVRANFGANLRRNGQHIVCITYTNRAVDVISARLGFDDVFVVSTLHGFLWGEVKMYQSDIREILRSDIIPAHIEKAREKDTGKDTKTARNARAKAERLDSELARLDDVPLFNYDDQAVSRYDRGQLNHDDIIDVAAALILQKPRLRKVLGLKYPYFFVDEAQDTFLNVVEALNALCADEVLPLVGYFGDPMQQIYDKRAGLFSGPAEAAVITKEENYRCSQTVVSLLNTLRTDVKQVVAGKNKEVKGSVELTLVNAEVPGGPRNRYTPEQLDQAAGRFGEAMDSWGWADKAEVKQLFLVRQMIARRLGFSNTHRLFTGTYASSRAQEDYEHGTHFLLKPFLDIVCPLIIAEQAGDYREVIDILRASSPAFDVTGANSEKSLREMMEMSRGILSSLEEMWTDATTREVLSFCREHNLCKLSERLLANLDRGDRIDEYDDELHSEEKSDWLCDEFFQMGTSELKQYYEFVQENTPLSTQHGVKGEEYNDVVVVFDDVEAAWNQYSFTKTFTPQTSGTPTDGQLEKSQKLAYVCFSRAMVNLRILLFTPDAQAAKVELIEAGIFADSQVNILA